MYEVEFKLDGMKVVPTHKNCGFALGEKQAFLVQKSTNEILDNISR